MEDDETEITTNSSDDSNVIKHEADEVYPKTITVEPQVPVYKTMYKTLAATCTAALLDSLTDTDKLVRRCVSAYGWERSTAEKIVVDGYVRQFLFLKLLHED